MRRLTCRRPSPKQSYEDMIKQAENLELKVRGAFNQYDVDRSGFISQEEVMGLLEDLGLIQHLKTHGARVRWMQQHAHRAISDAAVCSEE